MQIYLATSNCMPSNYKANTVWGKTKVSTVIETEICTGQKASTHPRWLRCLAFWVLVSRRGRMNFRDKEG
jgi:hypothetical protein